MVASQGQQIEVRRLPAGKVAYQTFRGTIPSIESVTSSVRSWVVTMGYKPAGPMAIELNTTPGEDLATEYEIEVQMPVTGEAKADPSDRVQIKEFAETDAVVMTLYGPHEITSITEPVSQMRGYISSQGLNARDVVRWVEITDPAKVSLDEQVTEVQFLVNR
jgi:effector-binding domain-containing protein